MKKIICIFSLGLILITIPVWGGDIDLTGYWYVDIECVGEAACDPENLSDVGPCHQEFHVNIIMAEDSEYFFEVINCEDYDADPCYGVLEGKSFYITCWDNIITGFLKNSTEMLIITQEQRPDPDNKAGTCKGRVLKVDSVPDCCEGIP